MAAYNPKAQEHQLVYNVGREDESFEWADLTEFHDSELRCGGATGSWHEQAGRQLRADPW